MNLSRRRFVCSSVSALVPVLLPALRAAAQSPATSYRIESVGVLDGDDSSFAFAISPRGWVTGMSRDATSGANQAFIYRDGEIRGRSADSGSSIGWSINKSVQITGFVSLDATTSVAARWDGTDYIPLPTLGGTSAQAFGINDDGVVVGGSQVEIDGPYQACSWAEGAVTPLASLGGASLASAINNTGEIVGSASKDANPAAPGSHAALWQSDELIDLGTIAGPTSLGRSINGRGQIVGHTTTSDDGLFGLDGTHALLWEAGEMTDLGALPGANTSFGWDINASGLIAGTSANPNPPADGSAANLAVIWSEGNILDHNSLLTGGRGWNLTSAYGINDAGQIVGIGLLDGLQRGFVLTPEVE